MRVVLLGVLVLAGCAAEQPEQPRPRLVAGPMQGRRYAQAEPQKTVQLSTEDVMGEKIRLGPEQKGPAVVYFMSKATRDESAELARSVDEQLVAMPIDQVGIVDMHDYGGAMKPIAMWQLRKSVAESRDKRRKRREEHHADASTQAVNRWHLVGDFDGALFKPFGVAQGLSHPLAFVVEPGGVVHGPYRDAAGVVAEVTRISGGTASRRTASR